MRGGRSADERRRAQRLGRWAEFAAAALMLLTGHRIIERRYKSPVGEIDLIAKRGGTYLFIEVKARATLDAAAQAITPHQRARIIRAAEHWISQNPAAAEADLRFDAILVGRGISIRHLKDAFQA